MVATIHAWLITVKALQDIHIPMIYYRFVYHLLLGFSSGVSIDLPCLLLIYFAEHLPSDSRGKEDSLDSVWLGLPC